MKTTNYLTILLILSLIFLLPLLEQAENVEILPKTQSSYLKNVKTQKLILTSNHNQKIELNVSSINLVENTINVDLIKTFFSKIVIDIKRPGFYQFDFFSDNLTVITFKSEGISNLYYIGITTLFAIRMILYLNNRYYIPIDELL